jgi:hypothetical protein
MYTVNTEQSRNHGETEALLLIGFKGEIYAETLLLVVWKVRLILELVVC